MDGQLHSARDRLFATPELLEYILTNLLGDLLPINDQEDPRSLPTHSNARRLMHLLRCSEVDRSWWDCMHGSGRLQRALFLRPDSKTGRRWQHPTLGPQAEQIRLRSYCRALSLRAPILNPIIQVTFPAYHFRFWHLSLEANGNKHCAYVIITRRDLPELRTRTTTRQGDTISRMLLSQPPCTVLEATIWEERDETKDYVGRTSALQDRLISCEEGLTLGTVHERVGAMFEQHPDVAAIKLTTS